MLSTPALLRHYKPLSALCWWDEFQDTNTIQYAWLRLWSVTTVHDYRSVSDDDQSIYGWRGAKIENIQSFTKDFKDVGLRFGRAKLPLYRPYI